MAKREKWNGSPVKPGNWGTWAQIEYGRRTKQSCYTCSHCHDEISCNKTGAIIAEIGKGFFRQCAYYELSEDYSDLVFKCIQKNELNSSTSGTTNKESIGKNDRQADKSTIPTEMRSKKHSDKSYSSVHVINGLERRKQNLYFVGKKVVHKTYGQGSITKAVDGKIVIDFSSKKEVTFLVPMCFEKGFLKIIT